MLLFLACAAEPEAPPAAPPAAAPDAPAANGTAPNGTDPNGTAPAATADTLLGKAPGVKFADKDWTSPSCGGRAYARNLRFTQDHTYAGIDLVSPCPEGATCAWSGMVGFAGVWRQEGTKLHLREMGAPAAAGGPHPVLVEATTDGKLVENGCFYEEGLTVPPGYDAERVRPKEPGAVPAAAGAEQAPAPILPPAP